MDIHTCVSSRRKWQRGVGTVLRPRLDGNGSHICSLQSPGPTSTERLRFRLGALSTPPTNKWGLPNPGKTLASERQETCVTGLCRQSLQIAPALSPPASAGSQAGDPCR